jgi:hypothetical protein
VEGKKKSISVEVVGWEFITSSPINVYQWCPPFLFAAIWWCACFYCSIAGNRYLCTSSHAQNCTGISNPVNGKCTFSWLNSSFKEMHFNNVTTNAWCPTCRDTFIWASQKSSSVGALCCHRHQLHFCDFCHAACLLGALV